MQTTGAATSTTFGSEEEQEKWSLLPSPGHIDEIDELPELDSVTVMRMDSAPKRAEIIAAMDLDKLEVPSPKRAEMFATMDLDKLEVPSPKRAEMFATMDLDKLEEHGFDWERKSSYSTTNVQFTSRSAER